MRGRALSGRPLSVTGCLSTTFTGGLFLGSLPDLLEAALTTLQVASLAMTVGVLLGFILAVGRMRETGVIYWFATTWVELARNTPALFQLFFFGFGLERLGFIYRLT